MDALDVIILALAGAFAVRGAVTGFGRQLGSMGGFLLGLFAGAWLASPVSHLVRPGSGRAFLALLVFFGVAISIAALGELLGDYFAQILDRNKLESIDASLGAAFAAASVIVVIWLLASVFGASTGPEWALEIRGSKILTALDNTLPPAPDVIARLQNFMNSSGVPRVFAGVEPTPAPPVTGPDAAAVNAAAKAGAAATVRVEGLGCGGLLEGTGIVVAQNLVITNAHVVAGIASPYVIDANGTHRVRVVLFDPKLDFAVLKVSDLAATALPLDSSGVARGTIGAVLGYPGGGPFTVSPAAVLQRENALGRDIYDSSLTSRDIYVLQAVVRPGNSGGPLITPSGQVIGIVFAMSTTNGDVGYALTSQEVLPDLAAAKTSGTVSTGTCAAD